MGIKEYRVASVMLLILSVSMLVIQTFIIPIFTNYSTHSYGTSGTDGWGSIWTMTNIYSIAHNPLANLPSIFFMVFFVLFLIATYRRFLDVEKANDGIKYSFFILCFVLFLNQYCYKYLFIFLPFLYLMSFIHSSEKTFWNNLLQKTTISHYTKDKISNKTSKLSALFSVLEEKTKDKKIENILLFFTYLAIIHLLTSWKYSIYNLIFDIGESIFVGSLGIILMSLLIIKSNKIDRSFWSPKTITNKLPKSLILALLFSLYFFRERDINILLIIFLLFTNILLLYFIELIKIHLSWNTKLKTPTVYLFLYVMLYPLLLITGYQGIWFLSILIFIFINSFRNLYFVPGLPESDTNDELVNELNDTLTNLTQKAKESDIGELAKDLSKLSTTKKEQEESNEESETNKN